MFSAALLVLLAAGCSPDKEPTQVPPPQKNVFDPLSQPVDRARDVQKTVDETAARERQAAAAQERGDAPP